MIVIDPLSRHVAPRSGGAALFLDRDGIINRDLGYVHRIEDFHFLDGIFPLCRTAVAQGLELIVVSNQAGIARGYYSVGDFMTLSQWMMTRFLEEEAPLARVIGCPHHPDFPPDGSLHPCACRKPAPGMILRAAKDFDINLGASILIGDKAMDIEAGRRAGVGTRILLQSVDAAAQDASGATHMVGSIARAEEVIIARIEQ